MSYLLKPIFLAFQTISTFTHWTDRAAQIRAADHYPVMGGMGQRNVMEREDKAEGTLTLVIISQSSYASRLHILVKIGQKCI